MAIKRRVIAASDLSKDSGYAVGVDPVSLRKAAVNELVSHEFAGAKIRERPGRAMARLPVVLA
jgi:hypothetical protein